jgi:hypothetical protein
LSVQPQRSDSVFLLTLVDFLIQIIFFGLFIFVVYQALVSRDAKQYDRQSVDRAVEAAGVSDLKELIDELSKLAPVTLKGFNSRLGDEAEGKQIKEAADAIKKAGGAAGVSNAMDRLAKLEKGSGLPPCLSEAANGQRKVVLLATAVGNGSTIAFTEPTPQLIKLLNEVGLSYGSVQSLGLREFPRVFQRVLQKYPNCRYTIMLRETTRMVDARDAAQQIFYTQLRR